MNQKDNPILKQIVANIAAKANQGRMPGINWTVLAEARKKKSVKEGNMAPFKKKKDNTIDKSADEIPADDVAPAGTEPQKGTPDVAGEAPPLEPSKDGEGIEGQDIAPQTDSAADGLPSPGTEDGLGDENSPPGEEDVSDAQADASQAKAELEKAKAEKDQAEKEIKKQSYVQLVSPPGVHFLLGKLVDHAFKSNTIDSLATEMTGKLKIQTPEDFTNFAEEMAPFKGIPGVAELLASMKGLATKTPDEDADSDVQTDAV